MEEQKKYFVIMARNIYLTSKTNYIHISKMCQVQVVKKTEKEKQKWNKGIKITTYFQFCLCRFHLN